MWSNGVIFHSPVLDNNSCFLQRKKEFAVKALVAQFVVETFNVSVLPGGTRLDVLCGDCRPAKPFLNSFGDELWSVVAPDKFWCSVFGKEPLQNLDKL